MSSSQLEILGTETTPHIKLDFDKNEYSMSGESYPEDVNGFYSDYVKAIKVNLEKGINLTHVFTFNLYYFNSSTSKVLIRLLDLLDSHAKVNDITVNWCFEERDDNMFECGAEFAEYIKNLKFNLKVC